MLPVNKNHIVHSYVTNVNSYVAICYRRPKWTQSSGRKVLPAACGVPRFSTMHPASPAGDRLASDPELPHARSSEFFDKLVASDDCVFRHFGSYPLPEQFRQDLNAFSDRHNALD